MISNLDFTCTFEDRNLDRVLFDRIHQSVNLCRATNSIWAYYPSAKECNVVIGHCLDRLAELAVSNFESSVKADKERLCRVVAKHFAQIQRRLLES